MEKLTDEEIKIAFDICSSEHLGCEDGCPFANSHFSIYTCTHKVLEYACEEIKRLKAARDAELDTIHAFGRDYESALDEINCLKLENERLINENIFLKRKYSE